MIPAEKSEFIVSAASHPGKGGEHNEDRFRIEAFSLDEEGKRGSLLAILADGIGAQRAGEVAAELAVEAVTRSVAQSDASQPTGILQAAIIQAGQVIRHRADNSPEWKGMGSTILCVWLIGRRLYMASVGNSRAFLMRQNNLYMINLPHKHPRHNVAEVKPSRGKSTEAEDPLLGYLGSASPIEVDFRLITNAGFQRESTHRNQGLRLQPNDRLLLCSDGLGDTLKHSEIREILGSRELVNVAPALIELALEKGVGQNLTALAIAVPPARPSLLARTISWKRPVVLALLASLLILISLFGWWLWVGKFDSMVNPSSTTISTLTPVATNTATQ